MSAVIGTTAGMAYLAQWMSDPKSTPTLDNLLTGWLKATGWKLTGLIWPATGKPTLARLTRADGTADMIAPPAEVPGVLSSLQGGSPTVVWQLSATSARLYALLQPVGHPLGVAWIEKPNAEAFTELETKLPAAVAAIDRAIGTDDGGHRGRAGFRPLATTPCRIPQ